MKISNQVKAEVLYQAGHRTPGSMKRRGNIPIRSAQRYISKLSKGQSLDRKPYKNRKKPKQNPTIVKKVIAKAKKKRDTYIKLNCYLNWDKQVNNQANLSAIEIYLYCIKMFQKYMRQISWHGLYIPHVVFNYSKIYECNMKIKVCLINFSGKRKSKTFVQSIYEQSITNNHIGLQQQSHQIIFTTSQTQELQQPFHMRSDYFIPLITKIFIQAEQREDPLIFKVNKNQINEVSWIIQLPKSHQYYILLEHNGYVFPIQSILNILNFSSISIIMENLITLPYQPEDERFKIIHNERKILIEMNYLQSQQYIKNNSQELKIKLNEADMIQLTQHQETTRNPKRQRKIQNKEIKLEDLDQDTFLTEINNEEEIEEKVQEKVIQDPYDFIEEKRGQIYLNQQNQQNQIQINEESRIQVENQQRLQKPTYQQEYYVLTQTEQQIHSIEKDQEKNQLQVINQQNQPIEKLEEKQGQNQLPEKNQQQLKPINQQVIIQSSPLNDIQSLENDVNQINLDFMKNSLPKKATLLSTSVLPKTLTTSNIGVTEDQEYSVIQQRQEQIDQSIEDHNTKMINQNLFEGSTYLSKDQPEIPQYFETGLLGMRIGEFVPTIYQILEQEQSMKLSNRAKIIGIFIPHVFHRYVLSLNKIQEQSDLDEIITQSNKTDLMFILPSQTEEKHLELLNSFYIYDLYEKRTSKEKTSISERWTLIKIMTEKEYIFQLFVDTQEITINQNVRKNKKEDQLMPRALSPYSRGIIEGHRQAGKKPQESLDLLQESQKMRGKEITKSVKTIKNLFQKSLDEQGEMQNNYQNCGRGKEGLVGNKYVWSTSRDKIKPSDCKQVEKYPVCVHVWAIIGYEGPISLQVVRGRLNSKSYTGLLKIVFSVVEFEWIAKGADLSPIEKCWALIKGEITEQQYSKEKITQEELLNAVKEVFYKSKKLKDAIPKMYNSLPQNIKKLVIESSPLHQINKQSKCCINNINQQSLSERFSIFLFCGGKNGIEARLSSRLEILQSINYDESFFYSVIYLDESMICVQKSGKDLIRKKKGKKIHLKYYGEKCDSQIEKLQQGMNKRIQRTHDCNREYKK
ncbi:hypothetical protein ABPG72_019954 [Tetrahymena utriculariae]